MTIAKFRVLIYMKGAAEISLGPYEMEALVQELLLNPKTRSVLKCLSLMGSRTRPLPQMGLHEM